MALQSVPYARPNLTELAQKLNAVINGGGNNAGTVTLTENATSTTITDTRIGVDSCVILMPTTANAAAALSTTYVAVSKGVATITHANNAQTDKTFRYAVTGG